MEIPTSSWWQHEPRIVSRVSAQTSEATVSPTVWFARRTCQLKIEDFKPRYFLGCGAALRS